MTEPPPKAASRRGFLKMVGASAAGAAAPAGADGSETSVSAVHSVAPVTILPDSRVAGAEHKLGVNDLIALQKGTPLTFRREPDNRWDKRAIAIFMKDSDGQDRQIGYVPRHENQTINDLIDAGHHIAGELIETERFIIHNRLGDGEVADKGHLFVEEVKQLEDGRRLVKEEVIRPHFRAWIATGQIAGAKPPDPDEVPGEPGWRRIVDPHKWQSIRLAAVEGFGDALKPGLEFRLVMNQGDLPGWERFTVVALDGAPLGPLDGPHDVAVRAAVKEGRQVRVVVSGITHQRWSGGKKPTPWPEIEIRASKAVMERLAEPETEVDQEEPVTDDPAPHQSRPTQRKQVATMSDIKLYHLAAETVTELAGTTDVIERSLQTTFETHLETLLGIRFLATEFAFDGGRIDTLGLDENNAPVILEFKRSTNENVINQGLFYLDWLVNHRKDFQWLVLEKLGKKAADAVDWTAPRLICVAGDYGRYDGHAINQIARKIELLRYRRFGNDLLMLEKVASSSGNLAVRANGETPASGPAEPAGDKYRTISQVMAQLDTPIRDRYEALRAFLLALGGDVEEVTTRFYIAFKRIKNFVCVEFKPRDGRIMLFLKLDPEAVGTEPGFTRDVSRIGHFGTGDLEVTLSTAADFDRAMPLIRMSYERA